MSQQHMSTEALADVLGIKPQTLHSALWRNGHYYGVKPLKLPNRRLLWPADAAARIMAGGQRE